MILSNIVEAKYDERVKGYPLKETFYKDMKEISQDKYNEIIANIGHQIVYDKIETYYLDDGWQTRYTKIMED